MSFFDKVTKAVGEVVDKGKDVVDKGKKDLDQFMRIQKINGEITAIEAKVAELKTKIQQNNQEAGAKAIALARAQSLTGLDLQVFVDTLTAIEQQVAAEQAAIAVKKGDIERLKAEHDAEHGTAAPVPAAAAPAPASPMATPPPVPATAPPDVVQAAPVLPPLPKPSACPQCGKPLTGGAFCGECGAKVG
jgi:hypothetical protein